jgi:hypothetical protein
MFGNRFVFLVCVHFKINQIMIYLILWIRAEYAGWRDAHTFLSSGLFYGQEGFQFQANWLNS